MEINKTVTTNPTHISLDITCDNTSEFNDANSLVNGFNGLGGIKIQVNQNLVSVDCAYTALNNAIVNSISYAIERIMFDNAIDDSRVICEHKSKV